MPHLSVLEPFIIEEPSDFAGLSASCSKFIDAWLDAGGEPTDDEIVSFYGLWSQSLDDRGKDETGFYQWAYPLFIEYRDEVRRQLECA
jgi:hypothetical protein